MIVRTYGRRNRFISQSFSDGGFDGEESLSQESLSQDSVFAHPFSSSQDSSAWSLDPDLNGSDPSLLFPPPPPRPAGKKPSKKYRNLPSSLSSKAARSASVSTSTLMEAQEFGEMMEHVDEVNFALDGLKPGQPARVRRGSLHSLLSICGSAAQRRLLRAKGLCWNLGVLMNAVNCDSRMMKTIIDAVLGLKFDDPPCTLAASALFFVLASDGQDEYLLDSASCIRFLLKLLHPPLAFSLEDQVPSIGGKLLSLRNGPGILRGLTKREDTSATPIILKVKEILFSCKEMKPRTADDEGLERPELSPKWMSLLTMEKACLSTVSLEDTSGSATKVGGNFKERLRELGGLDAIFHVAASCHTVMEGWSKHGFHSFQESKDDSALQSVVLLLKCLKVMENATFLSLSLSQESSSTSNSRKLNGAVDVDDARLNASEGKLQEGRKDLSTLHPGDRNGFSSSNSIGGCIMRASLLNKPKLSLKRQRLPASQSEFSFGSETTSTSGSDAHPSMKERNSLALISWDGTSKRSLEGISVHSNGSKTDSVRMSKRPHMSGDTMCDEDLEDSQDPFAFDEFDPQPSKWEVLSIKKEVPQPRRSRPINRELEYEHELQLVTSNSDSINESSQHSLGASCSSAVEEEDSNLLDDCLLTAVKVLMNLTNDNPEGCQQIASCGGLDTMAALIIGHFPLFASCLHMNGGMNKRISMSKFGSRDPDHQNGKHLSDQERDFLVAILGLLVNLVEKDSRNRSRLAAASVPLPRSSGMKCEENNTTDVIPLLCSIFLANQGAGEAAEEGRQLEWVRS
ncbi:hypothetical protein ACLOJK_024574 [Asimina triloba]